MVATETATQPQTMRVELTVNGQPRSADVEVRMTLADFLRGTLGLTGTHLGCEHGVCGSCTVVVDGDAVRSCQVTLAQAAGKKITTIEGLHPQGQHPLQVAWIAEQVPQCGYCQSGQIMQAAALLAKNPKPTDADINTAMAGNLCRCATYLRIRRAIKRAAQGV